MSESKRIADQLRRSQQGSAWHGPALGELLRDVDAALATRRLLAGAHNIWELVAHVAAWQDAALGAVKGQTMPELTDQEDWPATRRTDEEWREAVARLDRLNRELVAQVESFPVERLKETVAGREYSFYYLFHGVAQHNLYHAGQVAILKAAARHEGRSTFLHVSRASDVP